MLSHFIQIKIFGIMKWVGIHDFQMDTLIFHTVLKIVS